jgi:hypothetical protein
LELANLVRRALASVQDGGRFGDRKVFIASLWIAMLCIDAEAGGRLTEGATLQHFKVWLLRSRLLTREGTMEGERLVVLCRADLVAAMDPALVAASDVATDGATFHFVMIRHRRGRVRSALSGTEGAGLAHRDRKGRKGRRIRASGVTASPRRRHRGRQLQSR